MSDNPYLDLVDDQEQNGLAPTLPRPAAPANPYLGLIDAQDKNTTGKAALAVSLQTDQNPDKAAQNMQLARKFKVPPATVDAWPEEFRTRAITDAAREALDGAPTLSRTLSDNPRVAANIHDDIPVTAATEQTARSLPQRVADYIFSTHGITDDASENLASGAYRIGKAASEALSPLIIKPALAAGGVTALADKLFGTEMADYPFALAYRSGLVAEDEKAHQAADKSFSGKLASATGSTLGILGEALATGGEATAARLGAGVGETIWAGVQHGIRAMLLPSAVGAQETAQKVLDAGGTPAEATRAGLASYASNTMAGIVPFAKAGSPLLARIGSGALMGPLQGEASRQMMNAALPESMQQEAPGLDDLVIQTLTGGVFGGMVGGHDVHDVNQRLLAYAKSTYSDAAKAREALSAEATLRKLSDLVVNGKMRERDTDTFKQLMSDVSEDANIDGVWIDARRLTEILDAGGHEAEHLKEVLPKVAEQMREALQTEGQVRIGLDDYASHIMGGGLEEAIIPHLRVDENGPTIGEARKFEETQRGKMAEEATKILDDKATSDEFKASRKQVVDGLKEKFAATKRYPVEVSNLYAEHLANFYTVLAKEGITTKDGRKLTQPHEVAKEYGLDISTMDSRAPGRDTLPQETDIDQLLQDHGEQVENSMDAERRWDAGERIFGLHDQGETPTEIIDRATLANFAPDQLMALPKDASFQQTPAALPGWSLEKAKTRITAAIKKAAISLAPKASLADRNYAKLDAVFAKVPDPLASEDAWRNFMSRLVGDSNVLGVPYNALKYARDPQAVADYLARLRPDQLESRRRGFELGAKIRQQYVSGEATPLTTGRLLLWAMLSRKAGAYPHEAAYMDLVNGGVDKWIQKALDGQFTEADSKAYTDWSSEFIGTKKGGVSPGAGVTSNANDYGRILLTKMSERDASGKSQLERLHDLIADQKVSTDEVRRAFFGLGDSLGIQNKVLSFALLVTGRWDTLVLDRVQFTHLWGDTYRERAGQRNIYDLGLAAAGEGHFGLAVYEALARGMSDSIRKGYEMAGMADQGDGTLGAFHWDSWLIESSQAIGHPTIEALTTDKPRGDLAVRQGKFDTFSHNFEYRADGQYQIPALDGSGYRILSPQEAADFQARIKDSNEGVVPKDFKVSTNKEHPWIDAPGVDRARYDSILAEYGRPADAKDVAPAEPADGAGQSADGERGRNGGGRSADGQLAPLAGAPSVPGVNGPDPRIVAVAEQYARDNGITLGRQARYAQVDVDLAKRIAAAYEAMPHAPLDPKVKEAYENLIRQTTAQYEALAKAGYKFWFIDTRIPGNAEYASTPWNAIRDMRANQEMGVFPTSDGFGSEDSSTGGANNPMKAPTGLMWPSGGPDGPLRPVLANDLFRAVHDAFGHGTEGAGFREHGEENAWQAHSRLFTGSAVGAITSETRGQNSWLNFGPHGEANRTAKVADTIFADQKTGLMPDWTWQEGKVEDAPDTFGQNPKGWGSVEGGLPPGSPDPLKPGTGSLGEISFAKDITSSPSIISIYKGANLSTFLHESAHFFLQVYADVASRPDAPAKIQKDMQTLLDWFGVKDIEAWKGMTADEQRVHHENFARGFENRLMSGEAPSIAQQSMYQRFASWLTQVYKSVRALGVELTPEVRGVMDRMVASEDAIKEAEAARGLRVLFEERPDGMTDEAWAKYQEESLAATGAAVSDLQRKSISDMKWMANAKSAAMKVLQREGREKRKGIGAEVTAEVDAMPVYQAQAEIDRIENPHKAALAEWREKRNAVAKEERDAWVAANPAPEKPVTDVTRWEATRQAQEDRVRAEEKAKATEGKAGLEKGQALQKAKREIDNNVDRAMIEWDKANPRPVDPRTRADLEIVADKHGFNSAEEMLQAIHDAGSRKDVIEAMIDQRMLERHGELTDPQSIERAAEAAIHNDVRARVLARELNALAKATGSARLLARAAEDAARAAVGAKVIDELRPRQYPIAEGKAGRLAMQAFKKGDTETAAIQKRAQLLNNRLTKAVIDAADMIRKGLAYQAKFDRATVRENLDGEFLEQIDRLRTLVDFRRNVPAENKQLRSLLDFAQALRGQGYEPQVPDWLTTLQQSVNYKKLTVDQFRGVIDTMRSLEHIARDAKKLRVAGEQATVRDVVDNQLVPRLDQRGEKFTKHDLIDYPDAKVDGFWRAFTHWMGVKLRLVHSDLLGVDYKFNKYDLHDLAGPFRSIILDRFLEANYRKVDLTKAVSDRAGAVGDALGKDWQRSLYDILPNRTLIDPDLTPDQSTSLVGPRRPQVYLKMTRGKLLAIARHVGNESNFDKLVKGWGWKPEDVVAYLQEHMRAKDWHATQAHWDSFDPLWAETEAMVRRIGGVPPPKVPAREFSVTTKDGEKINLRGGYSPIDYDPIRSKLSVRKGEFDMGPTDKVENMPRYTATTTSNGSLNARAQGYTDRVSLDFHGADARMRDTIHDLAYREALIDATKIINDRTFRGKFMAAYGREEYAALVDWMRSIKDTNVSDPRTRNFDKVMQYTRQGVVLTGIGYRVSTVLKHGGAAALKSLGYLGNADGAKFFASRLGRMGSGHASEDIAAAKEKFSEIRARSMQMDRDYKEGSRSMYEAEGPMAKNDRFGHAMVAWSDLLSAVPTAWAAYDLAITKGVPASMGGTGVPMSEAAAVSYANSVVRQAHGSALEVTRSNFMQSRGAKGFFGALYGFMNNTYGQMADLLDKSTSNGYFRNNPAIAARLMATFLVPAVWTEWLKDQGPDSEGTWLGWGAKALVAEGSAMVPFVRDAVSILEYGRNPTVAPAQAFADVVNSGKDLWKEAHGESTRIIQDLSNAIGEWAHIAGLGQLGHILQHMRDVANGKKEPSAWHAVVGGHEEKK